MMKQRRRRHRCREGSIRGPVNPMTAIFFKWTGVVCAALPLEDRADEVPFGSDLNVPATDGDAFVSNAAVFY